MHAERGILNPLNLASYILNPKRSEQFIMHAERDYNITALIVEDFCCLGAAPFFFFVALEPSVE